MQNREPIFREQLLSRQFAAKLPVGDVVTAILPNGQKQLVWGDDVLEAVIRFGKSVPLLMVEIRVETIAEAHALAQQYWAACDDATGSC
jgi:hypothetical protein